MYEVCRRAHESSEFQVKRVDLRKAPLSKHIDQWQQSGQNELQIPANGEEDHDFAKCWYHSVCFEKCLSTVLMEDVVVRDDVDTKRARNTDKLKRSNVPADRRTVLDDKNAPNLINRDRLRADGESKLSANDSTSCGVLKRLELNSEEFFDYLFSDEFKEGCLLRVVSGDLLVKILCALTQLEKLHDVISYSTMAYIYHQKPLLPSIKTSSKKREELESTVEKVLVDFHYFCPQEQHNEDVPQERPKKHVRPPSLVLADNIPDQLELNIEQSEGLPMGSQDFTDSAVEIFPSDQDGLPPVELSNEENDAPVSSQAEELVTEVIREPGQDEESSSSSAHSFEAPLQSMPLYVYLDEPPSLVQTPCSNEVLWPIFKSPSMKIGLSTSQEVPPGELLSQRKFNVSFCDELSKIVYPTESDTEIYTLPADELHSSFADEIHQNHKMSFTETPDGHVMKNENIYESPHIPAVPDETSANEDSLSEATDIATDKTDTTFDEACEKSDEKYAAENCDDSSDSFSDTSDSNEEQRDSVQLPAFKCNIRGQTQPMPLHEACLTPFHMIREPFLKRRHRLQSVFPELRLSEPTVEPQIKWETESANPRMLREESYLGPKLEDKSEVVGSTVSLQKIPILSFNANDIALKQGVSIFSQELAKEKNELQQKLKAEKNAKAEESSGEESSQEEGDMMHFFDSFRTGSKSTDQMEKERLVKPTSVRRLKTNTKWKLKNNMRNKVPRHLQTKSNQTISLPEIRPERSTDFQSVPEPKEQTFVEETALEVSERGIKTPALTHRYVKSWAKCPTFEEFVYYLNKDKLESNLISIISRQLTSEHEKKLKNDTSQSQHTPVESKTDDKFSQAKESNLKGRGSEKLRNAHVEIKDEERQSDLKSNTKMNKNERARHADVSAKIKNESDSNKNWNKEIKQRQREDASDRERKDGGTSTERRIVGYHKSTKRQNNEKFKDKSKNSSRSQSATGKKSYTEPERKYQGKVTTRTEEYGARSPVKPSYQSGKSFVNRTFQDKKQILKLAESMDSANKSNHAYSGMRLAMKQEFSEINGSKAKKPLVLLPRKASQENFDDRLNKMAKLGITPSGTHLLSEAQEKLLSAETIIMSVLDPWHVSVQFAALAGGVCDSIGVRNDLLRRRKRIFMLIKETKDLIIENKERLLGSLEDFDLGEDSLGSDISEISSGTSDEDQETSKLKKIRKKRRSISKGRGTFQKKPEGKSQRKKTQPEEAKGKSQLKKTQLEEAKLKKAFEGVEEVTEKKLKSTEGHRKTSADSKEYRHRQQLADDGKDKRKQISVDKEKKSKKQTLVNKQEKSSKQLLAKKTKQIEEQASKDEEENIPTQESQDKKKDILEQISQNKKSEQLNLTSDDKKQTHKKNLPTLQQIRTKETVYSCTEINDSDIPDDVTEAELDRLIHINKWFDPTKLHSAHSFESMFSHRANEIKDYKILLAKFEKPFKKAKSVKQAVKVIHEPQKSATEKEPETPEKGATRPIKLGKLKDYNFLQYRYHMPEQFDSSFELRQRMTADKLYQSLILAMEIINQYLQQETTERRGIGRPRSRNLDPILHVLDMVRLFVRARSVLLKDLRELEEEWRITPNEAYQMYHL